MARTAARRPAKPAAAAKSRGGMRPVFIAAGLAFYWFAEYQDHSGFSDMPVWGYAMTIGMRLLADFVGAWVVIAALQLLFALGKLGVSYLRGFWAQERSG